MRRHRTFATTSLGAALVMTLGCSSPPGSPTSPTAAASESANNTVGVSLKVSDPVLLSPAAGESFISATVTLVFEPARAKFVSSPVAQEVTVRRVPDGSEAYHIVLAPTSAAVSHSLPALDVGTYEWLVRGAQGDTHGAWSAARQFSVAPPPSSPASGFPPGVVGPGRSIPTGEAIRMIVSLHDREGWNLGSRSAREERVAFLWRAVAVLHFGHPVYNPAGPDADWCVKDAGAGRPPSDDVIVRCSSREAWDILLSAGGDGYHFHEDYLGRLGNEQNVYPPPHSSLPR